MSKTLQERFDEKWIPVTESGCWLWIAGSREGRYGSINYKGRPERAHRISYMLHIGEIPAGMVVCHKCDVPFCVNPDHLFIGTQLENMQDRGAKQRTAKGERSARAKYSDKEIENAISLHSTGSYNLSEIERISGISQSYLSRLVRGLRRSETYDI